MGTRLRADQVLETGPLGSTFRVPAGQWVKMGGWKLEKCSKSALLLIGPSPPANRTPSYCTWVPVNL